MLVLSRSDSEYHLGHLFLEIVKCHPRDILQIDAATGEEETNASVLRRSVRLARCFRKLGLQPGDVLALGGTNHLDLYIPYYAALMNGLPVTGVDPWFKLDEIKTYFSLTRPKIAFCLKENIEDYKKASTDLELDTLIFAFDGENSIRDLINKYDDNAPIEEFEPATFDLDKVYAWLVCTGGTMGGVKIAAMKHKPLLHKIALMEKYFKKPDTGENNNHKLSLHLPPVHGIAGPLCAIFIPLCGYIKLMTSAKVTAEHTIDIINKYKPAFAAMTPTLLTSILKNENKCDFTCFTTISTVGERLPKPQIIKIRTVTREPQCYFETYGQTENLGLILLPNPLGPLGNSGKCMPGDLVKLIDSETGKEITDPNIPGELWTKTVCFSEYYNNPVATAKAFSEDGFFKTGDIFYRDEDCNFFFIERLGVLIKYKNYHIVPVEVEELIRTHPGVEDVCVTSMPHPEDGEWPVACVVKKNGATVTAQEIEELVVEKLSDNKKLRGGVIFMDELPLTSIGKLARGKLKKMVADIKNKI